MFNKILTLKKSLFVIVLSVVVASTTGSALSCSSSPGISTENTEELDTYLKNVVDNFDIPGIAVAITKEGKLVYTYVSGVRNLNTAEPLTKESLFHLASVSKPFVATAILQLVEYGKISLDDPVVTYLPYFELADERYKDITIKQMLNHTSGMPDVIDYGWDNPQYDNGAAERYVRSLKEGTLISAPGTEFHYSNMAFDVLGDVIAKVSGQTFEAYVEEHILDQLGMTRSSFLIEETPSELRTSPHIWDLTPVVSEIYPYNRYHAPSSTLQSNIIEMANWAIANLNRGKLNEQRILNEESYELLWGPSANISDEAQVGLSWLLKSHKGTTTVSHGGGDEGYQSYMALLPEENISVIAMSNYLLTPISDIGYGIMDFLLGYEPQLPMTSIAFPVARAYSEDGLAAAKELYYRLESEAVVKYSFGPKELNQLGYYLLLAKNQVPEAIEVLTFNVELYPDVANTYDSLGEAHMMAGQKEEAILNYEKSLELDPKNTNAITMLEQLRAE